MELINDTYQATLLLMVAVAVIVFLVLFFVDAPYGRHERAGWGPVINNRAGWLVMEAPASLIMLAMFFLVPAEPVVLLLLLVWQCHYFHRAFIYPFTLRSRSMPLVIALMAIAFNSVNASLNGIHFLRHADWYTIDWLLSANFIAGALLFVAGFVITKKSDAILRSLKTSEDEGYKIPQGFLFRWVSSPNYLGECIEWLGWYLMTLSPAGLVFFIWTMANLVPRAISHHNWYRQNFESYPAERRAILPYVL